MANATARTLRDPSAAGIDLVERALRQAHAHALTRQSDGVVIGIGAPSETTVQRRALRTDGPIVLVGAADRPAVLADATALPLADGRGAAAWSTTGLVDLSPGVMPLALAELHRVLPVGASVDLLVPRMDGHPDDTPGAMDLLAAVVAGAGFDLQAAQPFARGVRVRAERQRTLADTVAPGLRLLIVGINPSVVAADRGVPFAGRGNRLWPALQAAGLIDRPFDTRRAVAVHRVGFTDLVKRATPAADDVDPAEHRQGLLRLERVVSWCQPAAVCVVGLAGWRAAVDRTAQPGPHPVRVGGRPCYLMPSTSGRNAATSLDELIDHLRRAAALADATARASSSDAQRTVAAS